MEQIQKRIYAQRKETIAQVFADAYNAIYPPPRLAAVTRCVRLKYATMNSKTGNLELEQFLFFQILLIFISKYD